MTLVVRYVLGNRTLNGPFVGLSPILGPDSSV